MQLATDLATDHEFEGDKDNAMSQGSTPLIGDEVYQLCTFTVVRGDSDDDSSEAEDDVHKGGDQASSVEIEHNNEPRGSPVPGRLTGIPAGPDISTVKPSYGTNPGRTASPGFLHEIIDYESKRGRAKTPELVIHSATNVYGRNAQYAEGGRFHDDKDADKFRVPEKLWEDEAIRDTERVQAYWRNRPTPPSSVGPVKDDVFSDSRKVKELSVSSVMSCGVLFDQETSRQKISTILFFLPLGTTFPRGY
jgi:hypothetical protein